MNVDEAFAGQYLKAAHIKGKVVGVTIKNCVQEEVGKNKELLWVVYFLGKEKGFVLKPTNARRIQDFLGTGEFGEWIGKEIFLHVERVEFGNDIVDAIRVKIDNVPSAPAPAPPAEETGPDEGDDVPF